MRVLIHPEGLSGDRAAALNYEERSRGLGEHLTLEVEDQIARILLGPDRWAVRPDGSRRTNCSRFPYYVAYLVLRDTLWIVAIAHARRLPGYWKIRLTEKP